MPLQKKKKFDYMWIIVGVCFLMEFVCMGFGTSNSGIYLTGITDALGFKRSLFSFNITLRYLATTVINMFFGALVGKFGAKKLIAAGFTFMTAAVLINAYANTIWVFYLAGVVMGFGNALTGTTMGSFMVSRWCKNNVGRMTGIVLCANGIGAAVAAQVITPWVYSETDPFGYRTAYKIAACVIAAAGILVVSLLREKPGADVQTTTNKKTPEFSWEGIPYEKARKRSYFLVMAVCTFFTGMILYGISGAQSSHMRDVQMNPATIAILASFNSVMLTFSKVLIGIACDRIGFRPVMIFCHIFTVVSVTMIGFIAPTTGGVVIAVIAAVMMAFAMPLETIMVPLMVKYMYGAASYAKVLGIYLAFSTVGFAVGSPLTNLSFDMFGSYVPYFWASAGVMAVIAVISQFALTANKKDKMITQEDVYEKLF